MAFSAGRGGAYAGRYPADDDECLAGLERLAAGGELSRDSGPALWWTHYGRFAQFLMTWCGIVAMTPDGVCFERRLPRPNCIGGVVACAEPMADRIHGERYVPDSIGRGLAALASLLTAEFAAGKQISTSCARYDSSVLRKWPTAVAVDIDADIVGFAAQKYQRAT